MDKIIYKACMFAISLMVKGNTWNKSIDISAHYYKVKYADIHKQLHTDKKMQELLIKQNIIKGEE